MQSAKTASGACCGRGPGRAAPVAVALMVTVVVAAVVPEGVTVAGLNAQETPAGRPEQAKLTAELNPFDGVMLTVADAGAVFVSVPLPGLIVSEKSGDGAAVIVTASGLDTDDPKLLLPKAAVIDCGPTGRLEVVIAALPVPSRVCVPTTVTRWS